MQYIQAKRLDNKLGMKDNRPLAVFNVKFVNGGFRLTLIDDDGAIYALSYSNLDWFREDFDVRNCRSEIEVYKELK